MSVLRNVRGRKVVLGLSAAATMLAALPAMAGAGQAASTAAPTLEIDVQIVDRDGQPIDGITPDQFNVEVNGRRRQVLAAEQVDGVPVPGSGALEGRRVYFIVIDATTFGPGSAGSVVEAVTTLVGTLPEGSLVGLVTLPGGPGVELTTDHTTVVSALPSLTGQRPAQQRQGGFGLSIGDVVEYLSAGDPTEIARRYCGAELSEDDGCPQNLAQEANLVVNGLETQARASLGMLSDFSTRLGQIPGRKVLVLVSAGVAVAERAGGRPDVGSLPSDLAEAVTGSNIAFYTLLLDRLQDVDSSDRQALGRWLEQFSAANGGALVRAQAGQDAESFARIARETASYYRLTVESTDDDVSDRPQRLRVRVDQRGSNVRARELVSGR